MAIDVASPLEAFHGDSHVTYLRFRINLILSFVYISHPIFGRRRRSNWNSFGGRIVNA